MHINMHRTITHMFVIMGTRSALMISGRRFNILKKMDCQGVLTEMGPAVQRQPAYTNPFPLYLPFLQYNTLQQGVAGKEDIGTPIDTWPIDQDHLA